MTATHEPETQEQGREETPAQNAEALVQTAETERGLSRTGAMGFGLVPRNFDEAWRMASMFAKSTLVPKQYQGKPEDILIAMQYGAEIGLPPMASLQSVAVINGKPGVYGDGFLGVIMSKPAYAKHLEYYELSNGAQVKSLRQADYADDETKAVSMFWRKGNPEPFTAEFSIGDAKRAKLWGKEGPWTTYPARQMKWRARGFAGRDGFAGELRGVKMAEELLDLPDDLEIVDTPIPEPQRLSEKSAGASTTAVAAPDPVAAPEPPPSEPAVGGRVSTPPTAKPAVAPPPKASAFTNLSPEVSTPGMLITSTEVLEPRGLYAIRAERKGDKGKTDTFVLLTDDEGLYKAAASCEGSESKFNLRWAGGKKPDGKTACKVLLGIEAAN
jgi:hypothetical protein